ncbi:MAG: alcohol dehydrogenase catalytic domain-containing protein [Actinobacteria bacterium]|nr:alcohol dehydrogenase catalytic domain-containing protein [Actinomycetota bacterium]MBI3685865.1 alcohol dehydrogenase catalytic domain-containing protein [Actinomycetota bacterium]
MRAAVYEGPGNIRVEQVPDPEIMLDTDALVAVSHAAISGNDLWSYRGYGQRTPGSRIGREFLGVVQDVGADVRTPRRGDVVIAPSAFSDGTCEYCLAGLHTSCVDGGFWAEPGHDGGQGEAVRVPNADGTLVVVPRSLAGSWARLLPLADVLPAGHHAAVSAGVGYRKTVAVVGDGAVGLSAVLASRRLGADRVVLLGHHPERAELGQAFGVTEAVYGHGEAAIEQFMSVSGGADCVLECVGAQSALDTAIKIAKDGATIGYVGTPHLVEGLDLGSLFGRNIGLAGGASPARAYLPTLLADVISGRLDASPLFDLSVALRDVADGYVAMDTRKALKVGIGV